MTFDRPRTLQLRPMLAADLDMVLTWRNHPDVRRHMYNQGEISREEHTRWFEEASHDPQRHLLILEVDTEPRAYVNFRCNQRAEATWGFYAAPLAPKGTGRLLGGAALGYAFRTLGLSRLWGEVLNDNVASQNFHLRQGFKLESILPQKPGEGPGMVNVHRYVLTREDWRANQENTE